jgi:hypothetical protein
MLRTDPTDPTAGAASMAGLAARFRIASHALTRLGLAARIAWGGVAVAALGALVYTLSQPAAADLASLYGGGARALSRAEAMDLAQVLEEAGIPTQVEAEGSGGGARVTVAREQVEAAYKAIEKAGRRPRSLEDLVDAPTGAGVFATAAEVERQQKRRDEQVVEAAIREIDPSLAPLVLLFREPARGLGRTGTTRVTVHLGTSDRRRIRPETIERIRVKVQAFVPGMADDGLTMLDSSGTPYIQAGHPAIAERNAIRARVEELTSAIAEQLDVIEGVRVGVTIRRVEGDDVETEAPALPLPVLPSVEELAAAPTAPATWPAPVVAVNQPFEDEVEADEAVATSAPAPAAESVPDPAPAAAEAAGRVDVLVLVPSTYYAALAQQLQETTEREPTSADFLAMAHQTETMIQRSVELVVPPDERGEVRVARVLVPGARRPTAGVAAVRERTTLARWQPLHLAVAGGIGLALAATAAVAAAGRRQRRRLARRERRTPGPREPRYRIDQADAPGPSERVRDLVRLDPGAAAGVLNRWIGTTDPVGDGGRGS